jgi:hypothetical protein
VSKEYWLGRKREAAAMARTAATAEARLIHLDLAGRYSVMAAYGVPLMLQKAVSAHGEQAALRLPRR